MPENSQLGNCVFSSFRSDLNKDSWTNWSYTLYIRLDNPASLHDVKLSMIEECKQKLPQNRISGQEDWENYIHFTPLDEVHYSTIGDKAATSKAAVYLLLCVSILILLTAAVNYMNFSLAETPHAIAFHQYSKGVRSFHFLFTGVFIVGICISLYVWIPAFITLALSVAKTHS